MERLVSYAILDSLYPCFQTCMPVARRNCHMKIFIRNIQDSTSHHTLRRFAEQLISPRWYTPFAVKGRVVSCVVQKIKDMDSGEIEYHGLLDIQPFKAAQLAIEKLNGAKLGGHYIEARQWHVRSYLADRRDLFRGNSSNASSERRVAERRRLNLTIEIYTPIRVEAVKGFHRQYGK